MGVLAKYFKFSSSEVLNMREDDMEFWMARFKEQNDEAKRQMKG